MSSKGPSSRKRARDGGGDEEEKRAKVSKAMVSTAGSKRRRATGEEAGDDDWREGMRNFKVAQLCGMELMYADTKPQEWDFEAKMKEMDKEGQSFIYKMIDRMYFIFGKTGTGKTWYVRDFLYNFRGLFPYGWIFSHTKHNGFWQQYFPNHLIISEYNDAIVYEIMRIQKSRIGVPGINGEPATT